MANITLGGTPVTTIGELPKVGSNLSDFELVAVDLSTKQLSNYTGKKLILNIFPSVNTGVCATSVRQFNTEANELKNTTVLCISRDLPFAQDQFCGAEGLDNVVMLSDFKSGQFGKDYGVIFSSGGFEGLLSRAIVVADAHGKIVHTEQVAETGDEPNYKAALEALQDA